MLLMVEKGISDGICHSIHRYAKANNKYMKNYNNNEESSYIQYLDANNLYGWAMSKELPVNGFKWLNSDKINEINEDFIKNYNENDNKGYVLEVDVKYTKRLHELHSDLPFLSERMKVNKCNKLVKLFNNNLIIIKLVIYLIIKIRRTHIFIETSVKSWIKVKKNP